MYKMAMLEGFIKESNRIESIDLGDAALRVEIDAYDTLLNNTGRFDKHKLEIEDVIDFQKVIQPGKPLRLNPGQNVRVGGYVAPLGSPFIKANLENICWRATQHDPAYSVHQAFEKLHPFMDGNGRTGRAVWAWQMVRTGYDLRRGFLHEWYYQSLIANQG